MNPIYVLQISDTFFNSTDLKNICDNNDDNAFFISRDYQLTCELKDFLENKFYDPIYRKIITDGILLGIDEVSTKKRHIEVFDIKMKNNISDVSYLNNTFFEDTLYFEGIVNATINSPINSKSFNGHAMDEIKSYFNNRINV